MQPQPGPHPHRIRILDLMNATANSEVSDFIDFTFIATEENSELLESAGLQSNDECAWKISVDNRKVPSLKYRVRSGKTVMLSYEAVEEENSALHKISLIQLLISHFSPPVRIQLESSALVPILQYE